MPFEEHPQSLSHRLRSLGYYYLLDRIGDTVRSKGENVSTMEVSDVRSGFEGVVDGLFYTSDAANAVS